MKRDVLEDRIGLTPVAGCSGRQTCDVVFLHGLGGGSHGTWAAGGDAELFWPAWLGLDLAEIGVWVFGYHADVSAWKAQSMPLADRGTAVLEEFANEGFGERPLVFVTHSLGGILAKQLLRHAVSYGVRRYEAIAESTRGIAFIATPHAGSRLANFADFARFALRTNEQVGDLEAHHPRLRELHNWFRKFQGDRQLACRTFCEMREVRPDVLGFKLPKGILVVDQTSAEPHIPGEVAIPLDEDHISICKPTSREAPLYKSIKRFVEECAAPGERAAAGSVECAATETDLGGRWLATSIGEGPRYQVTLELEVLRGRVLGSVRYPTGRAGITAGTVDGSYISFRTLHTPQFETAPAEISFEGTLRGDRLELVSQSPTALTRFAATRVSADAAPAAPMSPPDGPRTPRDPILHEPFDDNENAWAIGEDRNWRIDIRGGELSCVNSADDGDVTWRYLSFDFGDFDAEITVRFELARSQGYANYAGLLLRNDDDEFYYFAINNGCGFLFGKHFKTGEDRWRHLVEEISPALHPGVGKNRLRVVAEGDRFRLHANDHLLTTVTDASFQRPGNVGLLAMSPTSVAFDDLKVRPGA